MQLAVLALAFTPLAAAAQDAPIRKASNVKSIAQVFEHEQQVWNAVKANDVTAFNRLVDGPFTYIDSNGMMAWRPENSAENLKGCTLNSFDTDEAQTLHPAGGMVILSYQITLDQVCNGIKTPSPINVLSVWQRKGNSWKLIAHSETATAPAR